jgi:hypothetical protein
LKFLGHPVKIICFKHTNHCISKIFSSETLLFFYLSILLLFSCILGSLFLLKVGLQGIKMDQKIKISIIFL